MWCASLHAMRDLHPWCCIAWGSFSLGDVENTDFESLNPLKMQALAETTVIAAPTSNVYRA